MKNKKTTYVIAEAGVNHNGSVRLAKKLIDVAANAGADAVKFQTFRAEALVTVAMPKAVYQRRDRASGSTQFEMLKKLELSDRDHKELYRHAEKRGIEFLSTPFDETCLDFLVELGVKKIKIPSGEITNGPLLLATARTGLPVILSTGMANITEVEDAVSILSFGYIFPNLPVRSLQKAKVVFRNPEAKSIVRKKVTLLHCTTEYPALNHDLNLAAMNSLRRHFGCRVGFSDHSKGIMVAVAAVALGAAVIEKHLTLDKKMIGPDHAMSLEPDEFAEMVRGIRTVESAIGHGVKRPVCSEMKNIAVVRKVLVASQPIRKGEFFTPENLTAKRAGKGVSPMLYWDILGKKAKRDFQTDQMVTL